MFRCENNQFFLERIHQILGWFHCVCIIPTCFQIIEYYETYLVMQQENLALTLYYPTCPKTTLSQWFLNLLSNQGRADF